MITTRINPFRLQEARERIRQRKRIQPNLAAELVEEIDRLRQVVAAYAALRPSSVHPAARGER